MLEYREKLVLEVAACTCDRCGRRMSPEDSNGEWQERVSLAWRGGFHSVFGDCTDLCIDLCQHCAKATLGEWIRVTHHDLGDGPSDLGSVVLAGTMSSSTPAVDEAYFDSLRTFIKTASEFIEKYGLPVEGSQKFDKSSVTGVSVDEMKAWRNNSIRAWRLLRLATYVWDDAADAHAWMHQPHPELGGKTPYEAAATDAAGAALVETLLGRIFYGIPT
ncbi:antitoxin Xre/MbcA/ParS toxin-binding domain-containing protein [Paraburkholderia youngii]|uniref:antitoxin Xre/MbcA/ParS toxin-binding domain-containing protein n=1 Tax=Paraburkholderia youngii TaxID=2782701 RepID=UPI003D2404B7